MCIEISVGCAKARKGATGEGGTAGVRENVRKSCRNSEKLLGLNRRIFKQMEKGENGSEGRYKRPGTLLMGKGTSLRGSGIAFPECGSGEPGGGGGGAKTGLHLPGGQTWEALRALYPEPN